MKKKIIGLILSLVLVLSVFTGCNLFERDTKAYLNQVIAKNGEVEITMEELVNGYYQYGQNLVSQYQLDVKSAINYTIDWLINRELLIPHIEELASAETADTTIEQKDYKYALTNVEYNELVEQVWGYVDSSITTIIDEIDEEYVAPTEDTTTAGTTKTVFEPTLTVVDGKVKKLANEDIESVEKLDKYAYTQKAYKPLVDKKAWNKYIDNLKKNEEGKKLSTNATDIFKREIDRMFKILYENKLLSKFQATYESYYGFGTDGYMTAGATQEILDYYKLIYNQNYEEYNSISSDQYYTDMISSADRSGVFYHYDPTEFYEVSHILVKFSDEQTAQIKALESNQYLTTEERNAEIARIKSKANTTVVEKDSEGHDTDRTYTVEELETIINDLQQDLRAQYTDDEAYAQAMAEAFDELLYKYNQDDGIMNAEFDYIVGQNHSGMVEPFTDEVRRLATLGEGSVSSSAVMSDYGYHIVLYTRKVTNIVENANDITVQMLNNTFTSRSSGKSMLEYIKSKVATSNYSTYETLLITQLKDNNKTVYYKDRYKSLYEA